MGPKRCLCWDTKPGPKLLRDALTAELISWEPQLPPVKCKCLATQLMQTISGLTDEAVLKTEAAAAVC